MLKANGYIHKGYQILQHLYIRNKSFKTPLHVYIPTTEIYYVANVKHYRCKIILCDWQFLSSFFFWKLIEVNRANHTFNGIIKVWIFFAKFFLWSTWSILQLWGKRYNNNYYWFVTCMFMLNTYKWNWWRNKSKNSFKNNRYVFHPKEFSSVKFMNYAIMLANSTFLGRGFVQRRLTFLGLETCNNMLECRDVGGIKQRRKIIKRRNSTG